MDPDGVDEVIVVALMTLTAVAGDAPNFTVAPAWKFEPVSVTAVPPLTGPEVGVMDCKDGGPT
jgi:hypothetical protein